MLFNSLEFLVFLPILFVLYWFVTNKSRSAQNLLLLVGSYIFYGWWDYRFLSLLFFSSAIDFFVSRIIYRSNKQTIRKFALIASLFFNLGVLFFFKYYNFFADSFLSLVGSDLSQSNALIIKVILPVGISFYTFQTLSYTLDVYYGKLKPSDNFIDFAVYVSFFPQLVAGPIERATNFLPQVQNKRSFDTKIAKDGLHLMLIGFFKKLVIADAFAPSVDAVFSNVSDLAYPSLIIGAVLFAFQIYCDFSGYSDIARGLAKILGFELMVNFYFPYFSKSIGEFWRRWHISLSTWFRDYLYIPLGGSRLSFWGSIRNVLIIFLVSGFWHGANWTFILWGLIHALLFIPSFIIRRFKLDSLFSGGIFNLAAVRSLKVFGVFILVTIAWVFFRAENVGSAFEYLGRIFSMSSGRNYFSVESIGIASVSNLAIAMMLLVGLLYFEYRSNSGKILKGSPLKSSVLLLLIIFFGHFLDEGMFIYFQF